MSPTGAGTRRSGRGCGQRRGHDAAASSDTVAARGTPVLAEMAGSAQDITAHCRQFRIIPVNIQLNAVDNWRYLRQ